MDCICGNYEERRVGLNCHTLTGKNMSVCANCGRTPPPPETTYDSDLSFMTTERRDKFIEKVFTTRTWEQIAQEMLDRYNKGIANTCKGTLAYYEYIGSVNALEELMEAYKEEMK